MLAKLVDMIKVNMHEAKTRLSQLVAAVSENHEVVVLCRNGDPVAEIKPLSAGRKIDRFKSAPDLVVKFHGSFDPSENATELDWPAAAR